MLQKHDNAPHQVQGLKAANELRKDSNKTNTSICKESDSDSDVMFYVFYSHHEPKIHGKKQPPPRRNHKQVQTSAPTKRLETATRSHSTHKPESAEKASLGDTSKYPEIV